MSRSSAQAWRGSSPEPILTLHGQRAVVVEQADSVGGRSGSAQTPDGCWIDFGHRDPHGVGDCQSPWHHGAQAARDANAKIVRQPTELPTPSSRAEARE